MQIEIAEHARMSERGSSLLRLIQNNDMPILDLLVRESIQNSMDAVKPTSQFVEVDINVGQFEKSPLVKNLEGVSDALNKSFPEEIYNYIKIRDSYTTGLTGPLHIDDVMDDNYGNLLKLVYEISMPQSREGAGGSWGLGKTIYYRLGIGLVIFYSRIQKEDGNYESRLAACMVEDETKEETIIPSLNGKPKRGIAWWGKKIKENSTVPLTDENAIKEIINIFNITPYCGDQTGTTVIIPFVDKNKLLLEDDEDSNNSQWWNSDIEKNLMITLQRWYAPRLDNISYQLGAWLKVKVNEKEVKSVDMEPVFKVIQALYNRTFFKNKDIQRDILTDKEYYVKEIILRKDLSESVAGKIAYVKIDKKGLLMVPPNNSLPPYQFVNLKESSEVNNVPLITYVRKPGMLVNYETSGRWVNGIEKTNPDQFIIGIFVPNSKNIVKSHSENITLEEYLRKSEKADHTSWSDLHADGKKFTLVNRIQYGVTKAINDSFNPKQKNTSAIRNGALSRSLAQYLLPPENFGTKVSLDKKGRGKKSLKNSRNRKANFIVDENFIYTRDSIKMNFEIKLNEVVNDCTVEVHVLSESGGIKGDEWEGEKGIGTKFPIEVSKVKIDSINGYEYGTTIEINNLISVEDLEFNILTTDIFSVSKGFRVINNAGKNHIKGSLILSKSDDFVQGTLVMTFNEVKK